MEIEVRCCQCGKFRKGSNRIGAVWEERPEFIDDGQISHSYCPECYEKFVKENELRQIAQRKRVRFCPFPVLATTT